MLWANALDDQILYPAIEHSPTVEPTQRGGKYRLEIKQKTETGVRNPRIMKYRALVGIAKKLSPTWRLGLRLPASNWPSTMPLEGWRLDDAYINAVHTRDIRWLGFERLLFNPRVYLPIGEESTFTSGNHGSLYGSGTISRPRGPLTLHLITEAEFMNNHRNYRVRRDHSRSSNNQSVIGESIALQWDINKRLTVTQAVGVAHTWKRRYKTKPRLEEEMILGTTLIAGLTKKSAALLTYQQTRTLGIDRPFVLYRGDESQWVLEFTWSL